MSWLGRLFVVVLMFGGSVGETETKTNAGSCESTWCGEIEIRFPFGLRGGGCSYPKFDVWCDDESRTMVSVGNAGELVVKGINYENQTIQVNDPNGCLPKRFLQNLSLKLSVPTLTFHIDRTLYTLPNLTFLTCDSNITQSYPLSPISCLADSNDSVIAVWPRIISPALSQRCRVISSALVPISDSLMWPFWPDLTSDIQLTWTNPDCHLCQARGLDCGFLNLTTNQVGCLHPPHANQTSNTGVPTSVKYGLSIGVGVPVGILCLIGVSFFICAKVRMHGQTQRRHFRPSVDAPPQPRAFKMGLDGSIIEKYPKTLLGESGRLPRPNDNTCPICLSEYQPKETLRTIPECNHYFHAHCIDQWLKMNATCPLCRNSPPFTPSTTSSTLSPSSSISSSSS